MGDDQHRGEYDVDDREDVGRLRMLGDQVRGLTLQVQRGTQRGASLHRQEDRAHRDDRHHSQRDPVTGEPLGLDHEHDCRHDRGRDQHHRNVYEQRVRGQAAEDRGDADPQGDETEERNQGQHELGAPPVNPAPASCRNAFRTHWVRVCKRVISDP